MPNKRISSLQSGQSISGSILGVSIMAASLAIKLRYYRIFAIPVAGLPFFEPSA
jgi:hypothetical protein